MSAFSTKIRVSGAICILAMTPGLADAQVNFGNLMQHAKTAIQQHQQQQPQPQQPYGGGQGSTGGDCAKGGLVGGIAGVALGMLGPHKPGRSNNVLKDAAIGAVAGCLMGAALGLSSRDQTALTQRSEEALSDPAPQDVSWTTPDSRQQVAIQTSEAREKTQDVDVNYDRRIEAPGEGTKILAATYTVSTSRLNFRSAPTTDGDSNIIGYFSRGENVEIIGRTPDGKWALVGDDGVVVGYAAFRENGNDLLVPEGTEAVHKKVHRAKPKMTQTASGAGTVRVAEKTDVVSAKVAVVTQCKSVTAATGEKQDKQTGCQMPNGGWAVI